MRDNTLATHLLRPWRAAGGRLKGGVQLAVRREGCQLAPNAAVGRSRQLRPI